MLNTVRGVGSIQVRIHQKHIENITLNDPKFLEEENSNQKKWGIAKNHFWAEDSYRMKTSSLLLLWNNVLSDWRHSP